MLIFNLQRVFALRGVNNPYTQLVKLGISRPTAWNLLNNSVNSIQGKHLEKICEYLNCTPDDIYEWRPGRDTQNVDDHPLKGLRREGKGEQLRTIMSKIPLDKMAEVEEILAGLTSNE